MGKVKVRLDTSKWQPPRIKNKSQDGAVYRRGGFAFSANPRDPNFEHLVDESLLTKVATNLDPTGLGVAVPKVKKLDKQKPPVLDPNLYMAEKEQNPTRGNKSD